MAERATRTSAAIVQEVPPTAVDWFVQWQRGISAAAERFSGYLGIDVYPPSDGQNTDWVTVLHFADAKSLERWINSPERADWTKQLSAKIGEFEVKHLRGGFSPWFNEPVAAADTIPAWKMAMTVLVSLYPTMMLLTVLLLPSLSALGFSASRLIGNAISVALLQWVVVPAVKVPLRPWLEANSRAQRLLSWGGLVSLIALLVALAGAFHRLLG
jgi:antibiotic biosynthesis monooxygenase (ABM) superfamily enzyme